MSQAPVFSPSDFVTVLNQTLEYAYPHIFIQGELADYRVSKGRWLYFKLRDEHASVQFFGTVHQLQHELQEGMMLQVRGFPRLHPQYGFSVQVQFLQPVGEGAIKKAADLLLEKLKKEGLFDPARKRAIVKSPTRIGLITSDESAAYQDFIKILKARWQGVEIYVSNVQVQGEPAVAAITQAIEHLNEQYGTSLDAIVLTRGGGSLEDLAAFSTEAVTRAVADSRVPTLVAVGHETDISLAELAADMRASTPSNAAELLVPHKADVHTYLQQARQRARSYIITTLQAQRAHVEESKSQLRRSAAWYFEKQREDLSRMKQLVGVLHPRAALDRGYAIIRDTKSNRVLSTGDALKVNMKITVELRDAEATALIQSVQRERKEGKS